MSIAVILVGGRGKRLGKLTLRTPKPLIKINNIRFLDILIKKISKFKIKKIYLLCSYKKEEFFNEYHQKKINKIKIICIDEGKQKDTGGALFKLKNKLNDHFYLFNGDTFLDFDFIKLSKFNKNDSIGTMAITKNNNYKKNDKLNNIKINNKGFIYYSKSKSNLMNAGVYFFKKQFLKYIYNTKISLENDILYKLIINNNIKGYYTKSKFIDIGSMKSLRFLKRNKNFLS